MQKDHPETPKRRIRRIRNAATPELPKKSVADTTMNIRGTGSRHRATMAPSDFTQPHNFLPKRRIAMDRMSILPSQLPLEGSRTSEAESNDTELKLLYDEYLQGIMTEIVIKRKTGEREKEVLTELATIAKERDHDEEKLFKLKSRERDIVRLTAAQNELDAQLIDANNGTKNEGTKTLENILSQFYSRLQSLDILRCRNIVLPKTPEEWKETEEVIKTCASTLESITNLIGSKGDAYRAVYNEIQDFLKTHSEIEDHQKRLEKALCDLQILVLKTASLTLTEDNDMTED